MLLGTRWSIEHFRTAPPHLDAPFALYPVTILKPLKGVDPGLRENLEGFFRLDYPGFELIFSVADARDPALALVQSLKAGFPGIPCRIVIGEQGRGGNPKVNNLVRAYDLASHDWILISDSNVRVKPDYLKRFVAHLDNDVGLVTAVVRGSGAEGFGARLETAYLNTFYSRGMVIANKAGHPCAVGKAMLFNRSTAKRFGGIATLDRYLAEDYMAGEAMRALGLKVIIATDPVTQHLGHSSFKDYWLRHVRWGRIRKAQEPLAFLLEPLGSHLLPAMIGALALKTLGVPWLLPFAGHLLIGLASDSLLASRIGGSFHWHAWAARELLALPLWLYTACGKTVQWRGRKMTIRMGGLLENA